jgi:hypothetical protein
MISVALDSYGVSAIGIVAVIALAGWWVLKGNRTRYPDVPTLRVSSRPGSLGVLDDIAMYVNDHLQLLQIGYDRYSRHGQNYLVNTPLQKELVLAPRFLNDITKAPDSCVSNTAANHEAGCH